jgi:putative cell wall-binding protein
MFLISSNLSATMETGSFKTGIYFGKSFNSRVSSGNKFESVKNIAQIKDKYKNVMTTLSEKNFFKNSSSFFHLIILLTKLSNLPFKKTQNVKKRYENINVKNKTNIKSCSK